MGETGAEVVGLYGTQTRAGEFLGMEVRTTCLVPKRQSSREIMEASAIVRPGSTPVMRAALRAFVGGFARDPSTRARGEVGGGRGGRRAAGFDAGDGGGASGFRGEFREGPFNEGAGEGAGGDTLSGADAGELREDGGAVYVVLVHRGAEGVHVAN